MLTSWNSVFIPKKLSGKGEEAKMFRLLLALSFVFILGTFAVSKNQSVSGNFCQLIPRYIVFCGWINVLKYPCWTRQVYYLNSCATQFRVVPRCSRFPIFLGFEEWNTANSVWKVCFEGQLFLPRRYVRIPTCWVRYCAQVEFAISWYFIFSFYTNDLFSSLFFSGRDGRDGQNGME